MPGGSSNTKKGKVSFEDRIKLLTDFESEHGHMFIPSTHKALGQWSTDARRGKYKFTDEQKSQLDKIGFVWGKFPKGPEKQQYIEWSKKFKLLMNFYNSKGHCNVPANVAGKPYALATWCDEQRQQFGDSMLDQSKIEKLTRLGFDFFGSSSNNIEEESDESNNEPDSKKRRRTSDNKKGSPSSVNTVEIKLEEFEKLLDRVEKLEEQVKELVEK